MFFFRVPVEKKTVLIKTDRMISEIDHRIQKIREANFDDAGVGNLKITSLTDLKTKLSPYTTVSPNAAANIIDTWKTQQIRLGGNQYYTNGGLAKIHRRQSQGFGFFSSVYNAISGLFATDTDRMIKRLLAKTQEPRFEKKIRPGYIHTVSKL